MFSKTNWKKNSIRVKVFEKIIGDERVKNFPFHKTETLYSVMRRLNFLFHYYFIEIYFNGISPGTLVSLKYISYIHHLTHAAYFPTSTSFIYLP